MTSMDLESAIAKLKAAEPRLPVVSQCVSDLMNDSQDAAQLILGLDYFNRGKPDDRMKLAGLLSNITFNCMRFSAKLDLETVKKFEEIMSKY